MRLGRFGFHIFSRFTGVSMLAVSLLALMAASACNLDNPGDDPKVGNIYFPTALALSSGTGTTAPRLLYVIGSNFDLRYNAGNVQAFDLDALDAKLNTKACKNAGADCTIAPKDVLLDEVWVSSFATSAAVSPSHSRLYVSTRSDNSLTYIDLDESADGTKKRIFACAGQDDARRCDDDHVRGDDSVQNDRRLRMPADPVAVRVGTLTEVQDPTDSTPLAHDYVLVAHREGQMSLFLDAQATTTKGKRLTTGPILTDVLSGLDQELTGLAFDPVTRLTYGTVFDRTGTGVVAAKLLVRVGVAIESATPDQAFLYGVNPLEIEGVALQSDTRALTFRGSKPGQALVLARSPASLLWVNVTSGQGAGAFIVPAVQTVNVGAGPSRLTTGTLGGTPVVLVSCFDSREIYVLHAETGAVLSIVHNLSGPFEIALDEARARLYVGDFRASVVRVIDLSPVLTQLSGELGPTQAVVLAKLGEPKQIQELQ